MSTLHSLRVIRPLAALLFGGAFLILAASSAEAQQPRKGQSASQGQGGYVVRQRGVGGYSLTLRDIWGPAKMPPAPTDFGPFFDYPSGYTLNGVPDQAPYPN